MYYHIVMSIVGMDSNACVIIDPVSSTSVILLISLTAFKFCQLSEKARVRVNFPDTAYHGDGNHSTKSKIHNVPTHKGGCSRQTHITAYQNLPWKEEMVVTELMAKFC